MNPIHMRVRLSELHKSLRRRVSALDLRTWFGDLHETLRRRISAIDLRVGAYNLHKTLYRKFPKLMSDPDYQSRLSVYRSRDDEGNSRSLPPDGESIKLRCMWAVEYYMPSHFDRLIAGFEKLGWDEEDDALATHSPVQWLRRRRETLSGGGWINLGPIERPGSKTNIPGTRSASLPDDVAFAQGYLYSITNSINCIVIAFMLKEETTLRYDEALRHTYVTELKSLKRGHAIIGPERQKEAAIRDIRNALRADLAAWFAAHLPGFFSSENFGADMPVCEFQTLTKGKPFPALDDGTTRRESYLMALGTDRDTDAWEYENIPGLKFAWPLFYDRPRSHHAIIAAHESDFDEEKLRHYGGRSGEFALAGYLDSRVNVMLGRWALLPVLSQLERHFNVIRNSSNLQRRSRKSAIKALKRYGDLYSSCVDIGVVTAELHGFTSDLRHFSHDVASFKPCHAEFYGEADANLSTILCESVSLRSEILSDSSESFQTVLTQQSGAVGTLENVRLQRGISLLTVIIVVLTIFMAWSAFREEPFWRGTTNEQSQFESGSTPRNTAPR